jgi:nitroreductase
VEFIRDGDAAGSTLNAVIDAIRARRTVKRMDPGRVPPREQVEAVLEAATWAPNHHLTEPWRFVVLEGDARRRLGGVLASALKGSSMEEVTEERLEKERAKPLGAPVIVALIGVPSEGSYVIPQEELVAAGAALQNMLLAAHSLGMATNVRTGATAYGAEVGRFFGLKGRETLIGMVYLGFASGPAPESRRTPHPEKAVWVST